MERYWDLSKEERAALTEAQVEGLCARELMEHGVYRPEPLVLLDETCPKLRTETAFQVKGPGDYGSKLGVGFRDPEAARAFLDLAPFEIDRDWTGSEYQFHAKAGKLGVEAVTLVLAEDLVANKAALERVKANKAANLKAREAHDKLFSAAEKALQGLWDDYRACQSVARELARVRRTFEEYKTLSNGDERIARGFLRKTFDVTLVDEALGAEVAVPDPVC